MENTVLYIDDEEVNLLLFKEMFAGDYCVYLARSTREAESLISQIDFKVIVSDINMPHETGLKFFSRLPHLEISPVFVILTAFLNDRFLLEALNQGRIFRYITKPFERELVRDTIDQAIKHYDNLNEKYQLRQQILESQRNFYNIFQSSRDGILILDKNEIILEANNVVERNLNKPVDSIKGLALREFLPPKFHANVKSTIDQLFHNGSLRSEFEYISEEHGKRIYELSASSIQFQGTDGVLIIIRDITERRLDELRLMNAVIQAEERERSRIAKDLHDGLGPIMSSLKMYLEWLNKQEFINDHPDILDLSLKSVNEAIVTLKRASNNLSPHILEKFGLPAALNKFIENVKNVTKIQFNIFIDLNDRLEISTEISLYRVITECLTNTIKHAHASLVEILLRRDEHFIYFAYQDNGLGFVLTDDFGSINGLGLHSMQNRLKTLGGNISVHSSPGTGFKLESQIPIL